MPARYSIEGPKPFEPERGRGRTAAQLIDPDTAATIRRHMGGPRDLVRALKRQRHHPIAVASSRPRISTVLVSAGAGSTLSVTSVSTASVP